MEVRMSRLVYDRPPEGEMNIDIWTPAGDFESPRSAAIFFPGGGWEGSRIEQFAPQAAYLARRGMTAASIAYRGAKSHGVTGIEAVTDCLNAVTWLKERAGEYGFEPDRLAVCGGSAGGANALLTAIISARDGLAALTPAAVVAFNPVVDTTHAAWAGKFPGQAERFSPIHNVVALDTPVLILHGTADEPAPHVEAVAFAERMREDGNDCTLVSFPDMPHGFFNEGNFNNVPFVQTVKLMDDFFCACGLLAPCCYEQ